MARPYWSGHIQISLVSFGVNLFVATEAKSDIHFHQIDRGTGQRVRHQKVLASSLERDPDEAIAPVDKSSIVKGYEYSRNQYITIEPEELANLRVPSKHTMDVTQFVDQSSIDPAFYEEPYFIVPQDASQAEAFLTVRKALLDTKKIAISKIAFAGREHIVAIAPAGSDAKSGSAPHPGMMAYTLRYAAELRNPADYFRDIPNTTIAPDSLSLARELIQRKSARFDPTKFVDGYEVAVKELVDAKLKHAPLPLDEAPSPARGKVINLMDALRKSRNASAKPTSAEPDKKPTPKKGPTLVKTSSKSHAKVAPKSVRSPRRKTA